MYSSLYFSLRDRHPEEHTNTLFCHSFLTFLSICLTFLTFYCFRRHAMVYGLTMAGCPKTIEKSGNSSTYNVFFLLIKSLETQANIMVWASFSFSTS